MIGKCPGQNFQDKPPELKYADCPQCGSKVELWPPSYIAECNQCGCEVRAEGIPSCADWCKYAKECLGEERYKEWEKSKNKEHALAIVSILRDHINKENNILYPMAEQVLTEEEEIKNK